MCHPRSSEAPTEHKYQESVLYVVTDLSLFLRTRYGNRSLRNPELQRGVPVDASTRDTFFLALVIRGSRTDYPGLCPAHSLNLLGNTIDWRPYLQRQTLAGACLNRYLPQFGIDRSGRR